MSTGVDVAVASLVAFHGFVIWSGHRLHVMRTRAARTRSLATAGRRSPDA